MIRADKPSHSQLVNAKPELRSDFPASELKSRLTRMTSAFRSPQIFKWPIFYLHHGCPNKSLFVPCRNVRELIKLFCMSSGKSCQVRNIFEDDRHQACREMHSACEPTATESCSLARTKRQHSPVLRSCYNCHNRKIKCDKNEQCTLF